MDHWRLYKENENLISAFEQANGNKHSSAAYKVGSELQ